MAVLTPLVPFEVDISEIDKFNEERCAFGS